MWPETTRCREFFWNFQVNNTGFYAFPYLLVARNRDWGGLNRSPCKFVNAYNFTAKLPQLKSAQNHSFAVILCNINVNLSQPVYVDYFTILQWVLKMTALSLHACLNQEWPMEASRTCVQCCAKHSVGDLHHNEC